jgi:hypothetical protein
VNSTHLGGVELAEVGGFELPSAGISPAMRAVNYFSGQPVHRIAKPADSAFANPAAGLTMMTAPGAVMKSKTD